MTNRLLTYRIRRRGALLLIVAAVSGASPLGGIGVTPARAHDSGGGGGSDGGGSDGGGSDDGGSDDGGSDDGGSDGGGSDDGGSDGGSSGGGSGSGSGSGTSSGGGKASGGQAGQARDGDLAQRLKNKIAPVSEVEALAGKVKPGEIIDIKLYKARDAYVYRVKVMQRSGSIYDLTFDAVSRKLLSTRER